MAAADLENTNWTLTAYSEGSTLHPLPSDAEVTLEFAAGRAGGRSACNRYSGEVTLGDQTLTFGPMLSTKMACPAPLMALEGKYLRILQSVAAWKKADDTLELRDGVGETLLVFKPA